MSLLAGYEVLQGKTGSPEGSGEESELMEHREAVEMMATEKYLLDELTPELREAYEAHLFDCLECANDATMGAAFIDRAKVILPDMVAAPAQAKPAPLKRDWFAWLRPAIMVPVFASLVAIIGYQNLVVYPGLELAANEPRILPQPTVLQGETRGARPIVYADLMTGSTVTVALPQSTSYASYKFDFYNSKNKLIWSHTLRNSGSLDDTVTLWLPGRIKQDSYRLIISGVTDTGENIPVQKQFFDLQVKK